ncbi:MAG: DUF3298 and DUF4163 domain-containing protein [Acetatifactor sp.]|nr:DUF3298 and DUF4163 domain-containing protein [Acetatifactor sp.]
MKRKVVGLLLALTLSVSVTACTNVAEVMSNSQTESSADKTQSDETGSEKDGPGKEASQEDGSGEGKTDSGETKESIKEKILFTGYYDDVYYGVNEKGEKVSEYRWEDVRKALKEKGIEVNGTAAAMGDGLIFYYQSEPTGNRYAYHVYAVDVASLTVAPIYTLDEGWWLDNLDYYQGKVYLTLNADNYLKSEMVFERTSEGLKFAEVENPMAAAVQNTFGYNLFLCSKNQINPSGNCSITRAFEETGFVIGYQDNQYYKISKGGIITKIPGMPSDYSYNMKYDAKGAVYSLYDNELKSNAICGVNFEDGKAITVSAAKLDEYQGILDYYNGKVYYYTHPKDSFVIYNNAVWEYDLATGKNQQLYAMKTEPGATDVAPGTQGFQIVGGDAYFIRLMGDQLKWVKRELDADGSNFIDLGLSAGEKTVFQYGNVTYDSCENNCKGCGIPITKFYGETFLLFDEFSPAADKINDALMKNLQNQIKEYRESADQREYSTEECEYHKLYPEQYCETYEEEISGVQILNEKYLTVDYSGYWYGGGAHGMPYMNQRLFDLSTGEEMTLQDFYPGSSKDFKKLIATKTKEDYLSYSEDGRPYFAEDADTVYQQAYDYALLDKGNLIFGKDGIDYYYPPYDMGPYASGYIFIHISYQELLGRPEL